MRTATTLRAAGIVAALSLSLAACSSGTDTASVDTNASNPSTGSGDEIHYDSDGEIVWVDHEDGSTTWYYEGVPDYTEYPDGTIEWVDNSITGGASMADGSANSPDSLAHVGDQYILIQENAFGEASSVTTGTLLGTYLMAPYADDDPGMCYVTFVEYTVDELNPDEETWSNNMYAPLLNYRVDGTDLEAYSIPSGEDDMWGLCDVDPLRTDTWFDLDDVETGVTLYAFDYVYIPEDMNLEAVIVGYPHYDDRWVYYEVGLLDQPPAVG